MSDLISHVAKVKAARSALSMTDVIPFFKVFNIPFEANVSIKPKKNLFNTLRDIFRVSTFQQLSPNTAIFSRVFISRLMTQSLQVLARICSESNALIKPKENVFCTNKENNMKSLKIML